MRLASRGNSAASREAGRFRQEAEADIYAVARYIAEDGGALEPAYRFIDTITSKAELLGTQPEMGRYRAGKGGIEVVRVLRGTRDIPSLF